VSCFTGSFSFLHLYKPDQIFSARKPVTHEGQPHFMCVMHTELKNILTRFIFGEKAKERIEYTDIHLYMYKQMTLKPKGTERQ